MVTPEKKNLSTALNAKTIQLSSSSLGAETILLSHGFGTDQSIWDKIIPLLLAENYNIVLFDWPFSGAVEDKSIYEHSKYTSFEPFADDLITVMDEMGLKDIIFVGHSMAAMIGCIASIERPDLFKRLVLLCASPRYINTDDDDNYEGGFGREDIEQLVSTIELQFENWIEEYGPIAVDPNDSASVNKFRSCLKKMDSEVVVSLAKTVFQSDNREILQKVETPCTIIQSSNDAAVPVSVGHYLDKAIKRVSALVFIDMIGHFPQLTAPHKLAEALKGVVEFDEY